MSLYYSEETFQVFTEKPIIISNLYKLHLECYKVMETIFIKTPFFLFCSFQISLVNEKCVASPQKLRLLRHSASFVQFKY